MNFGNFHPDKIELVDIITLGRASSFFLQGFFDGHSECITIPTTTLHGHLASKNWRSKDLSELSKLLYDNCISCLFERASDLFVEMIHFEDFKKYLNAYIEEFGFSRKNVFVGVHFSVTKIIYPQHVETIRYIIYQTHLLGAFSFGSDLAISKLQQDFPKRRIIFPVRDPRATWLSVKKYWPATRTPFLACNIINYKYAKLYRSKYPENVLFVRHEDLHCQFKFELIRIKKFLNISHEASLEYSSFFEVPYDGKLAKKEMNSSSGLAQSVPDKRYVNEKWKDELTGSEIRFVEFMSNSYMKEFNYSVLASAKKCGSLGDIFPSDRLVLKNAKNKTIIHKIAYALSYVPVVGKFLIFFLFLALWAAGYLMSLVYLRSLKKLFKESF